MKILMISGEYPPMEGGVADFTRIVARHLAALGTQVHVLTSIGGQGGDRESSDVTVWPVMGRWGWRSLARAVRDLCHRVAPDVINIQYQTAAYAMRPAINLLPTWSPLPSVVTFHDLKVPYLFPKAGALRWRANLVLARSCWAAIVTNAEDRELLARAGGSNLHVIPIGSNIRPFPRSACDAKSRRRQLGAPEDTLLLCYFGFLNASKGGEDLIRALAVIRERGVEARLIMIGASLGASDPTNRGYLESVRDLIQALHLQEHLVWTGHLPADQVSETFYAADICVLPYRDGVSFRRGSLMAAMAHGMPIVSTAPVIPLAELEDGRNMALVPVASPRAIADAVCRLHDDRDLRLRLGQGAKKLSFEFTWESIAARTIQVLEDALDSPNIR